MNHFGRTSFCTHEQGDYQVARYYFDMRKGDELLLDDEGIELSTVEAAQEEAAHSVADMARDAIRRYSDGGLMAIEVRDADGPVLQIKFKRALTGNRHS